MWEIFEKLCKERGVTPYRVCEETGIKTSAMSGWKAGKYKFKTEKLKLIADYFGVTVDYLLTGEEPDGHYVDEESAEILQQLYQDPGRMTLFKASKNLTPDQVKLLCDLALSWQPKSDF